MTIIKRILLLLLFCSVSVFAKPLYIEIVGGQEHGIPIVVVPFSFNGVMDPIERASSLENISNIVRNDLHNSGHFRTIEHGDYENLLDYGYWKNLGAVQLVSGNIIKRGFNSYDIEFKLVDIYNSDKPLLSLVFKDRRPEHFRALAHHISDLIFKKVTGVRGFFSTRIAYITVDRQKQQTIHTLVVADADGYNDKPLLTANYPIMSPSWSPNAKKIAFVSFRGHRSSINVVDLETGAINTITKFPGINGAPEWSPDGSKLSLVLSKDGAPKIYILDLATKELTKVTSGGSIDTEPFWHPNGLEILFTSNRGGKPQIYKVNLQSKQVSRVTFNGDYNATPLLTPDGKKLVMLHKSDKGSYNIAVQDMNSGRLKIITRSKFEDSPSLAPNGMMVIYGMQEADYSLLGAVTLDGKFRMRLPIDDSNVKEPVWSPFLVKD